MKSIKAKITVSIIICSLLSSIIVGVLSIISVRQFSNTGIEQRLALTCQNQGNDINALISRIEQSVDLLSNIVLDNLDFEQFSNAEYVTEYTNSLVDNFYKFGEHTDGAISIYIRYNPELTEPTSGIFLIRNNMQEDFSSIPPTDFTMYDKTDLAHVGWYYIPVEHGSPLWMDPYTNENVNIYMISYVVPLFVDGISVGIIGMDIDFSIITALANTDFGNGYGFIYNSDETVVYHPAISAGTKMTDVEDSAMSSLAPFLLDKSNAGKIKHYNFDKHERTLAFYPLNNGMFLAHTVMDDEIEETANNLTFEIVIIMLVCLVVCSIFGFLISTNISRPIQAITEVIRQTAQLDFRSSGKHKKLISRKDETGIMANAVREMRNVFRKLVADMQNVKDNILANMEQMESIMSENNSISEDNSATTQELAAGMEQTTAGTSMMSDNVNSIYQNAMAIQSLSKEGQDLSTEIKNRARNLRDTTNASNTKALEIYQTMKQKTSEAIEQSKAVAKINELTDNIKNISTQTNLLALNANIEAARAGDAGRGFTVVATEIGDLSNQTYKTVEGINQMVTEVNNAVSNMTDCITTIMDFLEKTVVADYGAFLSVSQKYENDATSFFDSMNMVYSDISNLNDRINEIAQTIDNVNQTISQSAEGVSLIAEKSSNAVSKTAEGYNILTQSKKSMEELKNIIEQFHV